MLFLDFKNFSGVSKVLDFKHLIGELDEYFKAFDDIVDRHHIEKIKTIGDAYMCVSGLTQRRTIPNEIVKAALEMQEFLNYSQLDNYVKLKQKLQPIRIDNSVITAL